MSCSCRSEWNEHCRRQACMPEPRMEVGTIRMQKSTLLLHVNFFTVVVYVWWQKGHSQFVALGKVFTRENIFTTFRWSFHQDVSPFWHKPIAWNETTDSYCLWVIPSNFLAIFYSGESALLKVFAHNNVFKSFNCVCVCVFFKTDIKGIFYLPFGKTKLIVFPWLKL